MKIKREKEVPCNGQCEAECTGHTLGIMFHTVSNVIQIEENGVPQYWMDLDEARALQEMLNDILK